MSTDPRDKKLEDKLEEELFKEEKNEKKWPATLKERVGKALEERFGEAARKKFEDSYGFVKDGALPGYSAQPLKILFISREVHSGCFSIVKHVQEDVIENKKWERCWDCALKVAYGLRNKGCEWGSINNVQDAFSQPGGLSFAIVEISKYINDDGTTNLSPYFNACAKEGLDFTRKEINILNPDLIISWNLSDALRENFLSDLTGSPEPSDKKTFQPDVAIWTYKFDDVREGIPLLDTWHFSVDPRSKKDPQRDIYDPLMRAFNCDVVQKLIEKKKAQDKKEQ